MTASLFNFVLEFLSLSWLTGPIFDKELRVSSRRRRNYVLRFAYMGLLTIFLVLIWLEEVRYGGSAVYQASRMAGAGQSIIMFIVWFQFCVTQLVAIIMLSTSISDEIYHRTLGLLMTTPINSFQIVMGKLFSKLLQLILLLAISLPLLAIVRVFGGVPWHYVLTSLCITVSAVIFVGSLSLFFSIFSRRAYAVIILTILTLGSLFALLPFMTGMLCNTITGHWPRKALTELIFYPNPYFVLASNTEVMMSPRGVGSYNVSWSLHCGIMLAASALVLSLSVIMVRKVACGMWHGLPAHGNTARMAVPRIRRINGSPAIWKELRTPMFHGHKIAASVIISIAVIVLLITYAWCADKNILDDDEIHMVYACIFMGLGILFTIILPATCVTSEKESRSWPLLLTTTLDDWQILFGKFVGTLRRCLPIWLFLFGHIIVFTLAGLIHPVAIIQMTILVTWIIVFLSCTGLYFSSRFRHTTTAVIMNFALVAVIWAIVPLLLFLVLNVAHESDDLAESYMDTNPFVHAIVVMDGTANGGSLANYYWPGFGSGDVAESTIWMLTCMLGYMFLGFLFAWRAKRRLRRNIF